MAFSTLFLNSSIPFGGVTGYGDLQRVGNIGNKYISYAIAKLAGLSADQTVWQGSIWQPEAPAIEVVEQALGAQQILVCLQDHLRADLPDHMFSSAIAYLRETEIIGAPLIAFSLCANSLGGERQDIAANLSKEKRRFFSYLNERAASIGVRGEQTADVMERLGLNKVAIVGCPSYFEQGPDRIVSQPSLNAMKAVGITGQVSLSYDGKVEHYLQGDYEWPLIDLLYMPHSLWRERENRRGRQLRISAELTRAVEAGSVHFFPNLERWRDHVRERCSVVVGHRLHGAILALNAGVPAIVTNSDTRCEETCEYFGIPRIAPEAASLLTLEKLASTFDADAINTLYRRRFATFQQWLDQFVVSRDDQGHSRMRLFDVERLPDEAVQRRLDEDERIVIRQLYQDEVGRDPTFPELDTWLRSLQHQSFDDAVQEVRTSAEADAFKVRKIFREYHEFFGREPDEDEIGTWLRLLASGNNTDELRHVLTHSGEGRHYLDHSIQRMYKAYFNRDATAAELDTWAATIRNGAIIDDMRRTLLASDEGQAGARDIIVRTYRSIAGRAPNVDEMDGWLRTLREPDLASAIIRRFGLSDSRA